MKYMEAAKCSSFLERGGQNKSDLSGDPAGNHRRHSGDIIWPRPVTGRRRGPEAQVPAAHVPLGKGGRQVSPVPAGCRQEEASGPLRAMVPGEDRL